VWRYGSVYAVVAKGLTTGPTVYGKDGTVDALRRWLIHAKP